MDSDENNFDTGDLTPEQIREQINKLSTFSPQEMEEFGIAFEKLVKDRQERIEEIKGKLMTKFALSEEELKRLSPDKIAKLRSELQD